MRIEIENRGRMRCGECTQRMRETIMSYVAIGMRIGFLQRCPAGGRIDTGYVRRIIEHSVWS